MLLRRAGLSVLAGLSCFNIDAISKVNKNHNFQTRTRRRFHSTTRVLSFIGL